MFETIPPWGIVLVDMDTLTTFTVSGMTCGHCVAAVTEEVSKLPGVLRVDIDLSTGLVTVTADHLIDEAEFAVAIDEAGFEVSG
jgi:copper chaperone